MHRRVNVEFGLANHLKGCRMQDRAWVHNFEFDGDGKVPVSHDSLFYAFLPPKQMVATGMADQITIYFQIEHQVNSI